MVVLPIPWGQVRRQFRHPNLHHHPPSCSLAEMTSPTQSHGQNIPEVGVTACRALAPSIFLGSFVLTLRPLSLYMSLAILCSRTRPPGQFLVCRTLGTSDMASLTLGFLSQGQIDVPGEQGCQSHSCRVPEPSTGLVRSQWVSNTGLIDSGMDGWLSDGLNTQRHGACLCI